MGDSLASCRIDFVVRSMACHLPPWPPVAAIRATVWRAISRHLVTYIVHGPMDWAPRLVSFLSFRLPATANRSAYEPDAVVDQPLFFHHPATAYSHIRF